MNVKFGTGGWRAVIGDGFTRDNIRLLTAALAERVKEQSKKGIVIGYDRRFLSKEAAQWAAEVAAGAGVPCQIIHGGSPTPLIMFTVKNEGLDYGMTVTASHNPAIYNGVKIFTKGGRDADETVTADLEKRMRRIEKEGREIPEIDFERALTEGLVKIIDPNNDYIDSIIGAVDMEAIRRRRLHIVLDPMYGVSRTALQTILITARCEVDVIHQRHDPLFGGKLPTPNMETLGALRHFVLEQHCDLGIATDGDADRLGIIDDKGDYLHPNKVLVLLYYYLLRYKGWRGAAVRNLSTTHLLDKIAADFGQHCYEVPVGFKHVSAAMEAHDALIGGESSGGLTVRGHISGKDGIYAGTLLVEMLAVTGRSLSSIYSEIEERYGSFEMVEEDYQFSREQKKSISKRLLEDKELPDFPIPTEKVSYLDGCKVYFQNGGWLSARFSGTEPLLRIFAEMPTREEALETCRILASFLDLKEKGVRIN